MIPSKYPNRVKEIREKITNITQTELARRLRNRGFRVTASYVSQIEKGLKNIPYILAIGICEELGFKASQVAEIFLPSNLTDSLEDKSTGTEG